MKRRRTSGMGRIFRRKSPLTGKELSTWWIAYHNNGKEVRESANTTNHGEAVRKLRERLKEMSDGVCVMPRQDRLTVEELLDQLVLNYENNERSSVGTLQVHANLWKRLLGHERAIRLTTGRLQGFVQEWKRSGSTAATINRRIQVLRRAYRLSKLRIDSTHLDFAEVMLPENSPRGNYITAEAFRAIHNHLPEYLKDFFEFAYLTGVRRSQLAGTTWANLNTETWVLSWKDPRQVKNRQPHEIALDGRPLEIVRHRWEVRKTRGDLACPYIFDHDGARIGNLKKAWVSACRAAGFPIGRKNGGYVFHNTRHTAVTNLVNAGVPAHEAMGVSGHRTRSVFDRYSIKLHEQTRAALRKATDYVQGLSSKPKVVQLRNDAVR
jgi:integrase